MTLELKPITSHLEWQFAFRLLNDSFPSSERRADKRIRTIAEMEHSIFHPCIIYQDGEMRGFISYWDFNHFAYFEHLAISPELRNQGRGTHILQLIKNANPSIVFEVELPENEISSRRLNFYTRNGASIIDKKYIQPPYLPEGESLPMYLLHFGEYLPNPEEIDNFLCIVYPLHYIQTKILPKYEGYDAAHRLDHIETVIRQSLQIAEGLNKSGHSVDIDMVYTIAAYHDIGICEGRDNHHLSSGRILSEDLQLKRWFTEGEISTMKEAVEDHRASNKSEPRGIYGQIVAEADRFIEPHTIILRTIQYGKEHHPGLSKEEYFQRTMSHLREKYGDGGYLKIRFAESPNHQRLEELRGMIREEKIIREIFEKVY